ncbi:MAG: hypothetical protein ACYC5A_04580 [Thermoleophilia bacterium]
MSKRKKRQVGRVTIAALLTLLVAMSAFTAIFLSSQDDAKALDASQWEYLRSNIDAYFSGQYAAGEGGTAGYTYDKTALQTALDSNGDMSPIAGSPPGSAGTTVTGVLGEGDDAANAPILIDNLRTQTAIIPGTSFRCNWNTADDCFSETSLTAIKELVDARKAAGFSTDIAVYCVSSHTASPTTGGFGAIAQTGALSSDGDVPNVYMVEYSRNGWRNNVPAALSTSNAIAAAETSAGGYANPTTAECGSETTEAGIVRCMADWAISSTGGNVSNGQSDIPTITGAGQTIDTRPSGSTLDTAGDNYQITTDTLFSLAGLANLDPSKTTIVVPVSQQGGEVAIALKMLGYDMIAGGFINSGIPRWNSTEGTQQGVIGDNLPLQTIASYTAPAKVETTAPVISSVVATPTADGATITWSTDEPATSILEWSLTQGGPYTKVNDTVLHAAHSKTITGQAAGTTIYYRVSSYDGYANGGTPTTESSVVVNQPIDHNTDYVYYMPWYDNTAIWGWMGAWVVAGNTSADAVNVELRINGVTKGTQNIAAGGSWFQLYPNLNDGMVEVICWDCKTGSDDLVVSQRAIFKNTFNEYIATEWDGLSDTWYFPWYDNTKAWGWNGSWIIIANPDTTEASVAITIGGSAIAESPVTVPANSRVAVKVAATTNAGPVKVDATGGQKLLVTERVLFKDSFNEVAGLPIPTP